MDVPSTSSLPASVIDELNDEIAEQIMALEPGIIDQLNDVAAFDPLLEGHLRITPVFTHFVRRFNAHALAVNVQFLNVHTISDMNVFLTRAIEFIMQHMFPDVQPQDRIGVNINHPNLDHPINVPFTVWGQFNGEVVLREIEKRAQSRKGLRVNELMRFRITKVQMPAGQGPPKHGQLAQSLIAKKSVIKSPAHDFLCLPRALIIARARSLRSKPAGAHQGPLYWDYVSHHRKAEERDAKAMLAEAGLSNHAPKPWTLTELHALHATSWMRDFKVMVLSSETQLKPVYEKGTGDALNLILHANHFDVVTKLPGFLSGNHYCSKCKTVYQHVYNHTECGERCPCCLQLTPCAYARQMVDCGDCNRKFRSQACFDNHKRVGKQARQSACDKLRKCSVCKQLVRGGQDHECGKTKCGICKQLVDRDHKCFMQPLVHKQRMPRGYIFFDFESAQIEDNSDSGVFCHHVNLAVAKLHCNNCPGDECGLCFGRIPRWYAFKGENALEEFCAWLFSPEHKNYIAIAHNARGYDAQFILRWIHKQGQVPKLVHRGMNIIKLEYCGLSLLDSLSFLPMPLSSFPGALGLDQSLGKGYFPHLFNKRENWGTVQKGLPAKHYYGYKFMMPAAQAKFDQWYCEHQNDDFDFDVELEKYCEMDVELLALGCLKFRRLILDAADFDCFAHCTTIASTCMYMFRKDMLNSADIIGIPPHNGYTGGQQSRIALKWLKWLEHSTGRTIRHAANGHEARLPGTNYLADGLDGAEIFEFYGCAFHGCQKCYEPGKRLVRDKTARQLYAETMGREARVYMQTAPNGQMYYITRKWECELKTELKASPEMQEFFDSLSELDALNPRDAFFGGRTNTRRLHHECAPGEHIAYIDVCSLYPWVCKYGRFPKGHPRVITHDFAPLDTEPYHGLIKCLVLPPQHLLHPVLPHRVGDKLLFPLCITCAQQKLDGPCQHTEADRQFWGTWPTCELYAALQRGYKVNKIAEVYHFDEFFEGETNPFKDYIDFWLKIKQQASGVPDDVEDIEAFIEEFDEREGIRLRAGDIEVNKGMRMLSKLFLNSFWGKLGQRPDLSQKKYINDPAKFFTLLSDPRVSVKDVDFVNDNMACVTYETEDEFIEESGITNCIIAAWVTAQARLKLYSYLEPLDDRVLYMDTDSVIYITRPTDSWQPEIGHFLGQMTNELAHGDHIEEFVSCGPKQYAYRTASEQTVCKIRGFTLNSTAAEKLNFITMKQLLFAKLAGEQPEIRVDFPQILKKKDRQVITRQSHKVFSFVYDKCYIDGMECLPYGYTKEA